jgi:hypothetical protein
MDNSNISTRTLELQVPWARASTCDRSRWGTPLGYRLFLTLAIVTSWAAIPAFAAQHASNDDFVSIETSANPNSSASIQTVRVAANTLIRQRGDANREKEEKEDEVGVRRMLEEDARLAPTCNPLKEKASQILQSAGMVVGPFNKAFDALKAVQMQLPGACPGKVGIFGGSITEITLCYNQAIYARLADGTGYVWTKQTRTFNYGEPSEKNQFIIGITGVPYYCLASIAPIIVYPGMSIAAMAKRQYDDSDRDRIAADRARGRARAAAELDDKIGKLTQRLLIDPQDPSALESRGNAYLEKGDYPHAIVDFDQQSVIQPTNSTVWNNRCWARVLANRELQRALADCNKSLDLAPDQFRTLDSRGLVYFRLGELDKAITDYNAALKIDDQLSTSLYGRGLAKMKRGDRTGGDADIAAAKKINSDIVEQFAGYGIK